MYYAFSCLSTMRDLPGIVSFFSIACGMSMLMLAAAIPAPKPTIDLQHYQECKQLYPERYCAISYAGLQK